MGYTIDMDTGGTFTDGFFTFGRRMERVKVDTTPHDLTVCFVNCIKEGAKKFEVEVAKLLADTDVIRFSSTIATNSLIERRGPRLGLIVTKGYEGSLYSQNVPSGLDVFVSSDMVLGIDEQVNDHGTVVKPVDESEVRKAVNLLLDRGARTVAVSLHGAFYNPSNEQAVKKVVNDEYPKHYLGAIPVLLSSEISARPGEQQRTAATVINAYLHRAIVKHLYKANEEVRRLGYLKPLFVVHSNGGLARVAKSMAINTYNSGPVAGVIGSTAICRLYNIKNLVTTDVGGTSTDIGYIHDGRYNYELEPLVEGIRINLPMIGVNAIGQGGGSKAKVVGGDIEVGPESAGAMPGPACYDLGGTDPTLTDADVVLGFVNPDYFLGGRRKLDKEQSFNAIKENIATPLGLSVEQAAHRIKQVVEIRIGDEIRKEVGRLGGKVKDFTLFAYGGAGPVHCCGFADVAGISKTIVFPYSSVFCAFGASNMDVAHLYERAMNLALQDQEGRLLSKYEPFNEAVRGLQQIALKDMRGEGFAPESVAFSLQLEIRCGGETKAIVLDSPGLTLNNSDDVECLRDTFVTANKGVRRVSTGTPGSIEIALMRLKSVSQIGHPQLLTHAQKGKDASKALKGERNVFWGNGFEQTRIYAHALLQCGNVVKGPAIIEAEDTTCVIPKDRQYFVDRYLNGVIEPVKGKAK